MRPTRSSRNGMIFRIGALMLAPLVLGGLAAGPVLAVGTAVLSLTTPDATDVISGGQVTLVVSSTHDTAMAASDFQIRASQDGRVVVTGRTAAPDLAFLSTDPADPFALQLPYALNTDTPLNEVLLGVLQAWRPGAPNDGLAAGSSVPVEALTVRLIGRGEVSVSAVSTPIPPSAAETQSDPNGALFDSVSLQSGQDTVTFNLALSADFDSDSDVDQVDFAWFQVCFSGSDQPAAAGCEAADFDGDGDVDADDRDLLEGCATGPGVTAEPSCRGQFPGSLAAPPGNALASLSSLPLGDPGVSSPPLGKGGQGGWVEADAADADLIPACGGDEPGSLNPGGCKDPAAADSPTEALAAGAAVVPASAIRLLPPAALGLTPAGPVGRPVPAFMLTTLDGGVVSNATLAEKIVVLNFIAPDCPWCKRELPAMDRLDAEYWNCGVYMVNVIGRLHREYRDDEVQSILSRAGSRITIARDPGQVVQKAFGATLPSGSLVYPTVFVLGPSGRIEEVAIGAGRTPAVRSAINRLTALQNAPRSTGDSVTVRTDDGPIVSSAATELRNHNEKHQTQPTPSPAETESRPLLEGTSYVPETLNKSKTYNLSGNHLWFFPVMASLAKDPNRPETDPLPWNNDLYHLFENGGYIGRYIEIYDAEYLEPFGLSITNGPGYPSEIPPASTWLIQYMSTGCNPALRNPATPAPPTFMQAKAAADAFCRTECGSGFEMTDFDMNQWKYICYNFQGKSYNVITWGGTICEKTLDNGLVEACNPLTHVVEVRKNLGGPLERCPECDADGDGLITLQDLIRARNVAFGPRKQALGMTFPIIKGTGKTIDQTLDLETYNVHGNITPASYLEITAWGPDMPLDCTIPGGQNGKLDDLTKSDPADGSLLNQHLANEWCRTLGFTICASSSLGIAFGHCRINKDGTHSIRATGGYCYYCM